MRMRNGNRCRRLHALSATAALAGFIASSAEIGAQNYPTRTVKMVVPYPAGGITDVLPRILSERLTRKWGQSIVIDNRPGTAGNIGAEAVFRADPDGYTLLVTAPSPLTVNQSLYPKLAFVPGEFVPVSILATIPSGLFVNPKKIAANTLEEFIAYARAYPGRVTAATQGIGTTSHLTSEWFQLAANIKFVQVPYRGSAPALQGLVAGDVDIMFDNLGVSLALAKSGQLKLLAVGTEKRMAELIDVPTLAEGVPGLSSYTWVGVFLPPRTPQKIADQLSVNFADALKQTDIAQKFRDHACEPVGGTPQATAAFVRAEAERWKNVIKTAGIKLE
jgi:tripartite-type tricarboxylate transporter receptor subunit TctC